MAFVEHGLSEDEFFKNPPYKFLLLQLNYHRQNERKWEHTRLLASSVYNASGRAKRKVKPRDIITLDIDRKPKKFEYDQDVIDKALKAWKPIKK